MSIYRLKGASGAVTNQAFTLGNRTVIGSGPDCDLRVISEGVAPQHAEVVDVDGDLLLKSLETTAETLLNGEAISEAALTSGDEIRIANCRWVLQAPGLRPQKVLTSEAVEARLSYMPWLIVSALMAGAALAWYQGWLPF
jgi:hypothetical protein